MAKKLLVLSNPNPEGKAAAEEYGAGVKALLAKFGGSIASRSVVTETVVGTFSAAVVMVVEFESEQGLKDFVFGDEYAALVPLRDQAFSQMTLLLAD
jgi:uncharacterized protein (DUF1330 family)